MRLPVIQGVIDRRILVNYRVEPDVLALLLPPPFRPQLVEGYGLAGICLIRLRGVRPAWAPTWLGMTSENAAHRIAVEWTEQQELRSGVYILRRDTSSRLNALAGGRVFPGVHHHARFVVQETDRHFAVSMQSRAGGPKLSVAADVTDHWPGDSVFASREEASRFFESGSVGYSPASGPAAMEPRRFQGLELRCRQWRAEALAVRSARSSLFDDPNTFPPGSIELDCALLMRGIEHEWHAREDICCRAAKAGTRSLATTAAR